MKKLSNKDRFRNYYSSSDILLDIYTKSENYHNWNSLYRKVFNYNNIRLALKRIGSNAGRNTAGPNGLKYDDLVNKDLTEIRLILESVVKNKNHKSRVVQIPKNNGGTRPLGITDIEVRVVQQCILNILECVVEPQFSKDSYGFRNNKSTKHAIAKISTSLLAYEEAWVYDCDLKGYFDTIPLDRCLLFLQKNHHIKDKRFLSMIRNIMSVSVDGNYNGVGLAQGTVLGPVLANVMLHDWELKLAHINGEQHPNDKCSFRKCNKSRVKRGKEGYEKYRGKRRFGQMIRYADDFIIISNNEWDLPHIISKFKMWCRENGLSVNEEKTKVLKKDNNSTFRLPFLGYLIKILPNNKLIISIKNETKKIREIKRELKCDLQNGKVDSFMMKLGGYFHYYDINTSLVKLIKTVERLLYNGQRRSRITKIQKIAGTTYSLNSILTYGKKRNQEAICDGWIMRDMTSKSIKDYTMDSTVWKPILQTDSLFSWIENVMNNRSCFQSTGRVNCFIAGLAKKQKREPILNVNLEAIDPARIEIHHKVPLHKGGTNEFCNLVLLDKGSHLALHNEQYNNDKYYQIGINKLRKFL